MAEARALRWTAADHWPPTLQRLVWVVAGLALSVVPHVPHIKFWMLLLAAGAAGLRIAMEVKHWQMLARWLRSLLAFVALLAVLLDYRTLNGIDAGTALLIVMAGMKLLETRTVRDLTVIVFLSYFALFAAFLYNQSLLRLPYMLVTAWLLTVTLMRIHQTTTSMSVREAVGITGKMFAQSLPLAVLLFLLFPRLPGQFWAVVPARGAATTGLSDEMSPGDVSDLSHLRRSRVPRQVRRARCRRRASATGADRCCTTSTAARGASRARRSSSRKSRPAVPRTSTT